MVSFRFLGLVGVVAVAGLATVFGGGGCSSSSSQGAAGTPCNEDPFQCDAGSTCGVQSCTCASAAGCTTENCTPTFACLPSFANGLEGANCTNQIGSASCDDGLTCIQEMNVNMGYGVCTAYCNEDNPCATEYLCKAVSVGLGPASSAPLIHVCQAPPADGDVFRIEAGSGPPPELEGGIPPFDAGSFFDSSFDDGSSGVDVTQK